MIAVIIRPASTRRSSSSTISDFREEQTRLRQQGKFLGIGFSTYVEICGIGPSSLISTGGWESATVRVEPTGKVTVLTGDIAAWTGTGNLVCADRGRRVGSGH